MPTPLSEAAKRAIKLLQKPNPKRPGRNYTITEAAQKTGVARSTLYRHLKNQEQPNEQ